MYKTAVPIKCKTLREAKEYYPSMKSAGVERVWMCGFGKILEYNPEKSGELVQELKKAVDFFRENGLEVGLWVEGFGHGEGLTHETEKKTHAKNYTKLTGLRGEGNEYGLCPKDPEYSADFARGIATLATAGPDLIMLDDDFRLNGRPAYHIGCFCDAHLKEYYERIGEVIDKEKLEKLIFVGGKNKYRDAYMDMMKDTYLEFIGKLRRAVDEVNPAIRMSFCAIRETWDYCGTDCVELAKAFAGNTKPFLRTIGAPYHSLITDSTIPDILENTRMQAKWAADGGVEVFTEGDVYPRPRYIIHSKCLELYDTVLYAEGVADGILKYMYDYNMKVGYETGYLDRHMKNMPFREEVRALFADKKTVGVQSYNELHKCRDWETEEGDLARAYSIRMFSFQSVTGDCLSRISIPTMYEDGEYPLLLCGENAKYVPLEALKRGAVLDVRAAEILQSRGVDCGLISQETAAVFSEYFEKYDDTILNISENIRHKKIVCADKAQVWSRFMPQNTPASYVYENAQGNRFYVLAYDREPSRRNVNYYQNYYRQQDMVEALEYVGRKKLPAVCLKNPYLYVLAAKNEKAMSVMLANAYADEILEPKIVLDKPYKSIRFVGCSGRLEGDTVYLEEMGGFTMAAFEVSE